LNNDLTLKEVSFNKIVQWLYDYGFQTEVLINNKDSDAEKQYEAKVYPPGIANMFFFITFGNKFADSFSISASTYLNEDYQKSIRALEEKDQKQIYIDLRKLILPLNINCDTRFPTVFLHKLIFIDSLKEKQFFFDSVFSLLNAMQLVSSRFDEVYYSFYPTGN